jgi:hypothetical protein
LITFFRERYVTYGPWCVCANTEILARGPADGLRWAKWF